MLHLGILFLKTDSLYLYLWFSTDFKPGCPFPYFLKNTSLTIKFFVMTQIWSVRFETGLTTAAKANKMLYICQHEMWSQYQ